VRRREAQTGSDEGEDNQSGAESSSGVASTHLGSKDADAAGALEEHRLARPDRLIVAETDRVGGSMVSPWRSSVPHVLGATHRAFQAVSAVQGSVAASSYDRWLAIRTRL
jgi:hypothetical protein